MSGAGDSKTHVSSWGWQDVDDKSWRTFRVYKYGKHVATITTPSNDPIDALILASKMFDPEDDWRADWVEWPDETMPSSQVTLGGITP